MFCFSHTLTRHRTSVMPGRQSKHVTGQNYTMFLCGAMYCMNAGPRQPPVGKIPYAPKTMYSFHHFDVVQQFAIPQRYRSNTCRASVCISMFMCFMNKWRYGTTCFQQSLMCCGAEKQHDILMALCRLRSA